MTRGWSRSGLYLILIVLALFYLMPIYILLVSGMKPYEDVSIAQMWDLPRSLYIGSFVQAWGKVAPNFWNSVQIAIPAALISSFIGSMNGYIFAKWRFRYSNVLFLVVLFGIFLPYQGVLIPLVVTLQRFHLYGSIPGLIFVHCIFGIPITALIFRSYFIGIPSELLDAAKIDGTGFFGIYRFIMFPIAMPAFAVALLWQFTSIWNDYLLGVVVLSNPSLSPVTVAVTNLAGSYFVQWNVQMAGALIAAFPTIAVYLLLGRLFMRGLLAGSLKG
ncbi:MAG TPA: carbohydrate ABC transporter permease [Chloroflexota bacterium]|nr:carbohydrate ABC transporter permease [Chloroflexota bacterium]